MNRFYRYNMLLVVADILFNAWRRTNFSNRILERLYFDAVDDVQEER